MNSHLANYPESLRVSVTQETKDRIASLAERHGLGMDAVARHCLELGLPHVTDRLRERAKASGDGR